MLGDIAIFVGGLIVVLLSSVVLAKNIERMGVRFGFTAALLGIVTALGADAPEISSAITAMHGGNNVVGVGIVFGSNVFIVAALLGISSLAAGIVRSPKEATLLNGMVALIVTLGGALIALSVLPDWAGIAIFALVFIPYVVICAAGPDKLETLNLPAAAGRFLCAALREEEPSEKSTERPARTLDILAALLGVGFVVIGSVGMVKGAEHLGKTFGVSDTIVGTLVLAVLTGVPNAIAAVRLAHKDQGAAVVSEAFNSNTLNITAGLYIPAVFAGIGRAGSSPMTAYWMIAMTIAAIALTVRKSGLHRWEGAMLIGAYGVFVFSVIAGVAGR